MNKDMDVIYLLTPETHIVECLLADFDRRRYRGAYLLWTSCKVGLRFRESFILIHRHSAKPIFAPKSGSIQFSTSTNQGIQRLGNWVLPTGISRGNFSRSLELSCLVPSIMQQPG